MFSKTKQRNVILGCWGLGGSRNKAERSSSRIVIKHGPFKGLSIPSVHSHGIQYLSSDWHLPPLARHTEDGIDMMPFILYDNVTFDKLSFECLMGAKPCNALSSWRPKPNKKNIEILEKLASNGYITLEDYIAKLNTSEIAVFLDKLNIMDLSDSNIIGPTIESLELWIKFHKDLLMFPDESLSTFREMITSLKDEDKDNSLGFGYLYECISDINRMLILSQKVNKPIYEWEDYCRFYCYKFMRAAKCSTDRTPGQTLDQLFKVFIPNFSIRSYNELMDIRNDTRLNSVRSIVDKIGDSPINKDLVIQANEDVLRVKYKIDKFSKYVGYAAYPLGLILPGIVETVIQSTANNLIKRWIERDVQWQMFFVERAIQYEKNEVYDDLKKQTHSSK